MEKQSGAQKFISVLITVIIASGVVVGFAYAFKGYYESKQVAEPQENNEKPIGGEKDEHGCLGPAGYSWCEVKDKCLRTWEEPCVSAENQSIIENYLKENISSLAPEKEVLGGKYFITRFRHTSPTQVAIDYEDGHNAYVADIIYEIENGNVKMRKFSLLSINDQGLDNAGNTSVAEAEIAKLFMEKYKKSSDEVFVYITDDRGEFVRGGVKFGLGGVGEGGIFLATMVDGKYKLVFDGNGGISCDLVGSYNFPDDMVGDCFEE